MTMRRVTIGAKPLSVDPTPKAAHDRADAPLESDAAAAVLERLGTRRDDGASPADEPAGTLSQPADEAQPAGAEDRQPTASDPVAQSVPAADASAERGFRLASGRNAALLGVVAVAVASGVAAALALATFVPGLVSSPEVRLAPLLDRITNLELRIDTGGAAVDRLNNEIAQSIGATNALAGDVAGQADELARLRQITDGNSLQRSEASPALFATAVIQLRTTFYSGRPFEAELVNVFALAGDDRRLIEILNELAAPARSGIPTSTMLRDSFVAFAAAANLRVGEPQTYYDYAADMLDHYVGYSTEPYTVQLASAVATETERKLMAGDVATALELVKGIEPTTIVATLRPWLESAENYVRVESAVAELTAAAVDRLRADNDGAAAAD